MLKIAGRCPTIVDIEKLFHNIDNIGTSMTDLVK